MAYCIKVKLEDVEKALAEVRPGHRLVAVCGYLGYEPGEAYERHVRVSSDKSHPVSVLDYPEPRQMQALYFEEEPEMPSLESMFQFDEHGNLCVAERGR